ncbi:MAG: ABC transporter ATP-binding protein [Candidatus Brockarchaeota archaeon]|nr:ABC transporter ATP-binding protein [Candidatus Brockarchaeota archaeon]
MVSIKAEGLTRRFGEVVAVEDLSFEVSEGEVFTLLGPNGAGKTTTVRMLSCLVAPTSGTSWIEGRQIGRDSKEIRRMVGVLPEWPGLYDRLTVRQNLEYFARLHGMPKPRAEERIRELLGFFGLSDREGEEVGGFSKGMRQRLALARALLHDPRVLFLDEPTAALDPEAAREVRNYVLGLKKGGRTIVICTHNLDEAERLSDRIAILRTRLLALDSPENLRRKLFGRNVVVHLKRFEEGILEAVKRLDFVRDAKMIDGKLLVRVENPEENNPDLIEALAKAGGKVVFLTEQRPTLEDIYFEIMKWSGAS